MNKIESEKESLDTELIDCKAILLRKEERERQWKKYAELWAREKQAFEAKWTELERDLKELKEKD